MGAENRRRILPRRPKRSARSSAEVGCSPRLAGEARPGFCRERNRRQQHHAKPDNATAGCAPGRSLVASGARRGEQPTEPPPPNKQPARQQTPCFPEPGPPEAPLTLISLRRNTTQEANATASHRPDAAEKRDLNSPPSHVETGSISLCSPGTGAACLHRSALGAGGLRCPCPLPGPCRARRPCPRAR
jgi:hypothetical protein